MRSRSLHGKREFWRLSGPLKSTACLDLLYYKFLLHFQNKMAYSSHPKRERNREAHLNYYASTYNRGRQLSHCKTKPPSWKIENRPYLRNGSTDLHEIWHGDAYWASEPDLKLKFSTFENPRWRSLTDEHLTEQQWQPVFHFSKPIVSIHVCCSYIDFSRSKMRKTGDLQVGNWHVNC